MGEREQSMALRDMYPDRQIWVGDTEEIYDGNPPDPHDVLTSLLAIGYENFANHPILPSSVMLDTKDAIIIYSTGRALKYPDDIAKGLMTDERPYVKEFTLQLIQLLENTH